MHTKLKEEALLWVACLNFLASYKREMRAFYQANETAAAEPGLSYFYTLKNTL